MIDFKLTKEELQKKYEANCRKIKELDCNINQLDSTMFESRVAFTFLFGTIFWAVGLCGLKIFNEMLAGLTMLQTGVVSTLLIGCSVGFGTVVENVLYKKGNRKKKEDFSFIPKTRMQKLELKMQYEMKKEKLKNQNKVIEQSLDRIEEEKKHIMALSDKYEIKDNQCKDMSENDLEEVIATTNSSLLEQTKYLDRLSIRNYTISRQDDISENMYDATIIKGVMFGLLGSFLWFVPFTLKDASILIMFYSLLPTISITTISNCIYTILKNKCDKEALKELNDKSEESISLESNSLESEYSLVHLINKSIHIASNLQLQCYEQKSLLEEKKKEELERETTHTQPISTLQPTIMMEQMFSNEYSEEVGPRYYKGLKTMR